MNVQTSMEAIKRTPVVGKKYSDLDKKSFADTMPGIPRNFLLGMRDGINSVMKYLSASLSSDKYKSTVHVIYGAHGDSAAVIGNWKGGVMGRNKKTNQITLMYNVNLNVSHIYNIFNVYATGDWRSAREMIAAYMSNVLGEQVGLTFNLTAGIIIHEMTHIASMHNYVVALDEKGKVVDVSKKLIDEGYRPNESAYAKMSNNVVNYIIAGRAQKPLIFKDYPRSDLYVRSIAEMEASASQAYFAFILAYIQLIISFNIYKKIYHEVKSYISYGPRKEYGTEQYEKIANTIYELKKIYSSEETHDKSKVSHYIKELANDILFKTINNSNIINKTKSYYFDAINAVYGVGQNSFGWFNLMKKLSEESFARNFVIQPVILDFINRIIENIELEIAKNKINDDTSAAQLLINVTKNTFVSYMKNVLEDLSASYSYFKNYFDVNYEDYKVMIGALNVYKKFLHQMHTAYINNANENAIAGLVNFYNNMNDLQKSVIKGTYLESLILKTINLVKEQTSDPDLTVQEKKDKIKDIFIKTTLFFWRYLDYKFIEVLSEVFDTNEKGVKFTLGNIDKHEYYISLMQDDFYMIRKILPTHIENKLEFYKDSNFMPYFGAGITLVYILFSLVNDALYHINSKTREYILGVLEEAGKDDFFENNFDHVFFTNLLHQIESIQDLNNTSSFTAKLKNILSMSIGKIQHSTGLDLYFGHIFLPNVSDINLVMEQAHLEYTVCAFLLSRKVMK